MLNKQFLTRTV